MNTLRLISCICMNPETLLGGGEGGRYYLINNSCKCLRCVLAVPPRPRNRYNLSMRTQKTGYTDTHAAAGLDAEFPAIDTWANQFRCYEVVVDDPEFTSVCPKTGLPDFGHLTIRYMPRKLCLELKSLKQYLFTYRNLGIFQENVVNRVLDDVVKACNPVWARVTGEFRPRGGISTVVEASWPRPKER